MTITSYTPALRPHFEEMLVEYFVHDLKSDIPEEIIRGKLMELIADQTCNSIIHAAIALTDEIPIGFSIYQIDTPDSDWCKRPGWGFIREFWIAKAWRGKGCGRKLAEHTEQHLRSLGASRLYLTSDGAVDFWEHCLWHNTHELCSNGLEILTK